MASSKIQDPYQFRAETLNELEEGVEEEREESSDISHPFDPEKLKVRTSQYTIDLILTRIKHNEIDLAPDFQRRSGIWDGWRKSRLIESLLLRIPIPVFYVAANTDETWSVVDGVQRISTVCEFVDNEFRLKGLEYLQKYEGAFFRDLPRSMQRRIYETVFVVNVIDPGTPAEVMFNIFRRINTGGMPLKNQEIRHALYPGPVRDYLKSLASTEEFLIATDRSVNPNRMADRECVLRFLAFHMHGWENYSTSDLDAFLGKSMLAINEAECSLRDQLKSDFQNAMIAAHQIFGKNAFRKYSSSSKRSRMPLNRALFEAWSVGLARLNPVEQTILIQRKQNLQRNFKKVLKYNTSFLAAITSATGDRHKVKTRFSTIDHLIMELI